MCLFFTNSNCFPVQHILSEPSEIQTMTGQRLPLKCSVDYISFSAHADYQQTSEFLRELKPPHVVGTVIYVVIVVGFVVVIVVLSGSKTSGGTR